MISGMESIIISKKEMKHLEVYHRKFLKNIQNLPMNTASSAVYLLLGALPIEATIDKNVINLTGAIARSTDSVIRELALKQLTRENLPNGSWFGHLVGLHKKYKLPHPSAIMESKPSRNQWKSTVSKAVNDYWVPTIHADLKEKSSLRLLMNDEFTPGKAHQMWNDTKYDKRDIRRGCIKAKMLTGTYTLQQNRARFNQFAVDPTCQMCGSDSENMQHFLLHCTALAETRKFHLQKIVNHLPGRLRTYCLSDDQLMEQIIMNCPKSITADAEVLNVKHLIAALESTSRGLCYALHCKRAELLCYRP